MDSADATRLADEAQWALASGDFGTALGHYQALEQAFPDGGIWPNSAADIYREMKQPDKEMEALSRAADRYAGCGAHLKAIVMCKRMIDLKPGDEETRNRLADLHPALRAMSFERPRAVEKKALRQKIESGAPLGSISLADAVGSDSRDSADIKEIPLFTDEDVAGAIDANIVRSKPAEPAADTPENAFPLTPFFAALNPETFRRLVDKFWLISLDKGEVAFRQGDPGDSFFVITEGAVEVEVQKPDPMVLARLDAGEFFGEIALITNHPRSATVRALEKTELIEVNRQAMSDLIQEDMAVMNVLLWFLRDRLVDTLVRTNELFGVFPPEERRPLADRFRFIETDGDAVLIPQGKKARGLIVVLGGEVEVVRMFEDKEILIARLRSGDICGENSLLTNEPALATVAAHGKFIGLELPSDQFRTMVAQHPKVLPLLEEIADRRRRSFVEALEKAEYPHERVLLV